MSYFAYFALESTLVLRLKAIILLVSDLLQVIISREPLLSTFLGNASQSMGHRNILLSGFLCYPSVLSVPPLPPPFPFVMCFPCLLFLGNRDCVRWLCGVF